jgi:NitT/TauT family transport system substrate-binding protein
MGSLVHGQADDKLIFIPQWIPQAQFAGFYTALDQGIYKKHGLDIEILTGGPENPPFANLKHGRAHFCSGWLTTGIQQRSLGLPVVNIAQLIQHSAMMLTAFKSSGITKPRDLDGRRVGLWGGEFMIQPLALFRYYNIYPEIVPIYRTINIFLRGGVDAISMMWFNEYHTVLNSGYDPDELSPFFLRNLIPNFPEDGIYCLEETLRTRPEQCRKFVAATLEGWTEAFRDKDATLKIVMKYADAAGMETNRAHQRWMLNRMQDVIAPRDGNSKLGALNKADYEAVGRILVESKIIEQLPEFERFHVGQY